MKSKIKIWFKHDIEYHDTQLNICVTKNEEYAPFVTIVTRRVTVVDQELLTRSEHLRSHPVLMSFMLLIL